MYFSKESICTLYRIISELNSLECESEQMAYLCECTEDADLFLQALKKVNQKKIPKVKRNSKKSTRKSAAVPVYDEKEISLIFKEKDEKALLETYSLAELKSMYYTIYQKKPQAKSKKEDIYKIIKNRFSTINRAAAFIHIPSDATRKKE